MLIKKLRLLNFNFNKLSTLKLSSLNGNCAQITETSFDQMRTLTTSLRTLFALSIRLFKRYTVNTDIMQITKMEVLFMLSQIN